MITNDILIWQIYFAQVLRRHRKCRNVRIYSLIIKPTRTKVFVQVDIIYVTTYNTSKFIE